MARKPGQSQDDVFATELARGQSVASAAKSAGFSVRTAFRRLGDAKFRARVSSLRSRLVDRAVGLLAATNAKAAATLRALLDDDAATVRLNAARCVLEATTRLRDAAELEERLQALERHVEKSAKGGRR